jgi:hypothetical protein
MFCKTCLPAVRHTGKQNGVTHVGLVKYVKFVSPCSGISNELLFQYRVIRESELHVGKILHSCLYSHTVSYHHNDKQYSLVSIELSVDVM